MTRAKILLSKHRLQVEPKRVAATPLQTRKRRVCVRNTRYSQTVGVHCAHCQPHKERGEWTRRLPRWAQDYGGSKIAEACPKKAKQEIMGGAYGLYERNKGDFGRTGNNPLATLNLQKALRLLKVKVRSLVH